VSHSSSMEALLENRFDMPIPAIVEKQVSHEISQFDGVRRGALSRYARRILEGCYRPVVEGIVSVQ
jgi:hypothetical protein